VYLWNPFPSRLWTLRGATVAITPSIPLTLHSLHQGPTGRRLMLVPRGEGRGERSTQQASRLAARAVGDTA
jgi:hypothetical protein